MPFLSRVRASIILLTSRLEGRDDAADIFYRRNSWLILFGIAHAYLFWGGDILYPYALCALVLYPFRKMTPRGLLITGFVVLSLTSVAYIGKGFSDRDMLRKGASAEAAEKAGKTLTDEQKDELNSYTQWKRFNKPTPEILKKNNDDWRGNPMQVIKTRAKMVSFFHSLPYYHPMSWDIWSMMLIGMGLFKLGVLSGGLPSAKYAKMALIGYGIGIPVNSYTAWLIIKSNFDPVTQSFTGVAYDIGRLSITLGHVGLILLLCKSDAFGWLTRTLGAVGQMAFSNYILQSVLTAFLFTGYGLKMYGQLERYQLYYVVAFIWAIDIIVSTVWLHHFRFGPLEWAWRSLTYWKRQPMRLRARYKDRCGRGNRLIHSGLQGLMERFCSSC